MAAVRLKCALGHNTALLYLVKNLCLKASFKYNGFSPKGQGLPGLWLQSGAFHWPFHCPWCNSGKKDFFARNEPLRRLVTVLVSAPIKIDFLHVHTT
jgi:hypothetical protein